jgi:hypothetical protein
MHCYIEIASVDGDKYDIYDWLGVTHCKQFFEQFTLIHLINTKSRTYWSLQAH